MIKRQGTVTVGDAFKYFITTKKARGISEKTIHNYEQSFEFFLRDVCVDDASPISYITEGIVFDWISTLKDRGIKTASINHYLTDMRTFLYFCMNEGYMKRFRIRLMKGQETLPKCYNDDEIEGLLKKPSASDGFIAHRTYVLICFILATGARASTLINIRLSDISFKDGTVTYRHLKNRSTTIIPLSASLSKVIREFLNAWKREREDGFLFCAMNEAQCSVSALYQSLEHYCKQRGVDSRGLHALRHSFARMFIVNGGNAFSLQRILTHADMTMTKRYVHLYADDLKKNYEQFCPLDNHRKLGRISRK